MINLIVDIRIIKLTSFIVNFKLVGTLNLLEGHCLISLRIFGPRAYYEH